MEILINTIAYNAFHSIKLCDFGECAWDYLSKIVQLIVKVTLIVDNNFEMNAEASTRIISGRRNIGIHFKISLHSKCNLYRNFDSWSQKQYV